MLQWNADYSIGLFKLDKYWNSQTSVDTQQWAQPVTAGVKTYLLIRYNHLAALTTVFLWDPAFIGSLRHSYAFSSPSTRTVPQQRNFVCN